MVDVGVKVALTGADDTKRQLGELAGSIQKLDPTAQQAAKGSNDLAASVKVLGEAAAKTAGDHIPGLSESSGVASRALGFLTEHAGITTAVIGVSLGAAVYYAGKALASATQEMLATGQMLNKLSQQTGVTVEALSGLSLVAAVSNTSIEQLSKGFEMMSRKVAEAQIEGKSASNIFTKLGIDVIDPLTGKVKANNVIFLEMIDTLSGYADGANKSDIMTQAFGRALGNALIPMVNKGSGEVRRLMEEAELAGQVMSGTTAQAADDFATSMTVLNAYTGQFWRELAGPTIGALAETAGAMRDARFAGEGFFGTIATGIITLARLAMFGSELSQLQDTAKKIATTNREIQEMEAKRPAEGQAVPSGIRRMQETRIAQKRAELELLKAEADRLAAFVNPVGPPGEKPDAPAIERGKPKVEVLRDELSDSRAEVRKYNKFLVDQGRMELEDYKDTLRAQLTAVREQKNQAADIAAQTGQKEINVRRRLGQEELEIQKAIESASDRQLNRELSALDELAAASKNHNGFILQDKIAVIDRALAADRAARNAGDTENTLSEERRTQLLRQRDAAEDNISKQQIARTAAMSKSEEEYHTGVSKAIAEQITWLQKKVDLEIKNITDTVSGADAQRAALEALAQKYAEAFAAGDAAAGAMVAHIREKISLMKTDNEIALAAMTKATETHTNLAVTLYTNAYQSISKVLTDVFTGHASVAEAIRNLWTSVGNTMAKTVADVIAGAMLEPFKQQFIDFASFLKEAIFKPLADVVKGFFSGIFSGVGKKAGEDVAAAMNGAASSSGSAMTGTFSAAATAFGGFLRSMFSGVGTFIASIFSTVFGETTSTFGGALKSMFSGVGTFITSTLSTVFGGLASFFGGLLRGAVGSVGGTVGGGTGGGGGSSGGNLAGSAADLYSGISSFGSAGALADFAAGYASTAFLPAAEAAAMIEAGTVGWAGAGMEAGALAGGWATVGAAVPYIGLALAAYSLLGGSFGGGGHSTYGTGYQISGSVSAANGISGSGFYGISASDEATYTDLLGDQNYWIQPFNDRFFDVYGGIADLAKSKGIDVSKISNKSYALKDAIGPLDMPATIDIAVGQIAAQMLKDLGLMTFATGGEQLVTSPTLFMAGEAGPENVRVSPMAGGAGNFGGRTIVNNFNGPFVTDSYSMKLFLRGQQRLAERGGLV